MCLYLWFSPGSGVSGSQGTLGSVWRHFWLSPCSGGLPHPNLMCNQPFLPWHWPECTDPNAPLRQGPLCPQPLLAHQASPLLPPTHRTALASRQELHPGGTSSGPISGVRSWLLRPGWAEPTVPDNLHMATVVSAICTPPSTKGCDGSEADTSYSGPTQPLIGTTVDPPPLYVKGVWIQTEGRWFFEMLDASLPSS